MGIPKFNILLEKYADASLCRVEHTLTGPVKLMCFDIICIVYMELYSCFEDRLAQEATLTTAEISYASARSAQRIYTLVKRYDPQCIFISSEGKSPAMKEHTQMARRNRRGRVNIPGTVRKQVELLTIKYFWILIQDRWRGQVFSVQDLFTLETIPDAFVCVDVNPVGEGELKCINFIRMLFSMSMMRNIVIVSIDNDTILDATLLNLTKSFASIWTLNPKSNKLTAVLPTVFGKISPSKVAATLLFHSIILGNDYIPSLLSPSHDTISKWVTYVKRILEKGSRFETALIDGMETFVLDLCAGTNKDPYFTSIATQLIVFVLYMARMHKQYRTLSLETTARDMNEWVSDATKTLSPDDIVDDVQDYLWRLILGTLYRFYTPQNALYKQEDNFAGIPGITFHLTNTKWPDMDRVKKAIERGDWKRMVTTALSLNPALKYRFETTSQ